MTAYYNEVDPYAAQWLRNLISAGLIAPGDVDRRSIIEVQPEDLEGYTQCHFFAGIGIWSDALRRAGWPDERPVWTGSCPCQPLSVAGQRKAHLDERHFWPAFHRLIEECRPPVVFGEQSASKDGREWLSGVRADLEAVGYACGAADLCSAGVGAPNIRQRLYWVACADRERCGGPSARPSEAQSRRSSGNAPRSSADIEGLGDAESARSQGQWRLYRPRGERHRGLVGYAMQASVPQWNGPTIAVRCSDGARRVSAQPNSFPLATGVKGRMGRLRAYGNAINAVLAAEFIKAAQDCKP